MTIQCCVCHRVRSGAEWVQPTPSQVSQDHVSHGYCPTCAAKAFSEIHDLIAAGRFAASRAATS